MPIESKVGSVNDQKQIGITINKTNEKHNICIILINNINNKYKYITRV